MEIYVNVRPSLLMETADLVCAYFNQISPEKLTSDKPYCIPAAEVAKIMEQVCGDLNREDKKLQFYFQGFPLDGPAKENGQPACVGSILVHTSLDASDHDLLNGRQIMHDSFLGAGRPYKIATFSCCGISGNLSDEYSSISGELSKLDMPDGLRLRMTEALSAYHHHVDQLCDLLEPLALRLQTMLEPWVEKLQPRIDQWRSVLRTEKGLKYFVSRFNINLDELKQIFISLRIFYPALSSGSYSLPDGTLHCSAGLEMQPIWEERETLTPVEIAALRLLSGTDRIEMLRVMSGRTMTPKEITQELGINPGTVFRDLNSLVQAHLLDMVVDGTHRSYTTNLEYLEKVTRQLVKYIRNRNET